MQTRAAAARGGLGEIGEETAMEEEEKVYVAVAKEAKEGKAIVAWLLQNTSENRTIVVLHIHRPSQRIPTGVCACVLSVCHLASKSRKGQILMLCLQNYSKNEVLFAVFGLDLSYEHGMIG